MRAYTMSSDLSSPLDNLMLKVAREVAQDIYPIQDILTKLNVKGDLYAAMLKHPRFQNYLISEREAWLSAGNMEGRTKLKAGMVLETFMDDAYHEMTSKANALSQRVELGKMLAKIAGFGEPKIFGEGNGVAGPGFMLQINIGPGVANEPKKTITIEPEVANFPPDIRLHDEDPPTSLSSLPDAFKRAMLPPEEDDYDPFTSPNTLEDEDDT